ncbi:MAG: amidohydrolase family protein [Euryarchaeota archaeon]|nr:amidohydrolase family protein [Euryarchaeota archaeon]
MEEVVVSGRVLRGSRFQPGHVVVRRGRIHRVHRGERVDADLRGLILPALVNAHTHLGDSVAGRPPRMSLRALVGPGGYKHRILERTPRPRLVEAMRHALREAALTGSALCGDFREGGLDGARALRKAARAGGTAEPVVFGRPHPGEPLAPLLRVVDGLGMSSTSDHPGEWLADLRREARRAGRLFAIHAGEAHRRDIEPALALEPDLLIHLTQATPGDLRRAADRDIPVVVCPRSNIATRVARPPRRPPVAAMLRAGLRVALGTDNAMLHPPNLWAEMETAARLYLPQPATLLRMATENGLQALRRGPGGLQRGAPARLLVLDPDSPRLRDPLAGVVRRTRPDDILGLLQGDRWLHLRNRRNPAKS